MTRIVLLKGVNVGGHNRLPMAELRTALTAAGVDGVQTYIQSGNILIPSDAPKDAVDRLKTVLQETFDIICGVVSLTVNDLDAALASLPTPDADPKTVHLMWPTQPCDTVDLAILDPYKGDRENIWWDGKVLILHTPDGFGRSKLAAKLPKVWPMPLTARNLKTVNMLKAMADGL